jgi:hypothetical protein
VLVLQSETVGEYGLRRHFASSMMRLLWVNPSKSAVRLPRKQLAPIGQRRQRCRALHEGCANGRR